MATLDAKVTIYAVKIPRGPQYMAKFGHTMKYTTLAEAERTLARCCDDCKLVVIPPFSR